MASATQELSKFDLLVKQNELSPKVASQLKEVLSTCEIVLLCDDSGSMDSQISEPNSNKKTTRWLELKKLASIIIEFVTSINPDGLDIYFLNRPLLRGVTEMTRLQTAFNNPPAGGTPLIGTIARIYRHKKDIPLDKNLLIIVITDGEPSDGTNRDLYRVLMNKGSNVHISFVECTDDEETMEYLDQWDNKIPNFDNTDDYREELRKVKRVQGNSFKFDYNDYVIKILLATFVKYYFNLDQGNANRRGYYTPQQTWMPPKKSNKSKGCTIF